MAHLPLTGVAAPILILLGLLSVTSIAIIGMKTLKLWRITSGRDRRGRALQTLKDGGPDAAIRALGTARTPADRVLVAGLDDIKTGAPNLRTTLEIVGNSEAQGCFRHIRTLETIAMISPLLGLLGTVLGMIQAFRDLEMAEGAANAALLAGGIWQALLTTAAGLIVALPAAAGAALLSARAETAVSETEGTIARLLAAVGERTKT